jgi:clan AA aspartic protease
VIQGIVNARLEAIVPLRARGPGGVEFDLDVVVDTGCTSPLSLPIAIVNALGLVQQSGGSAVLADGTVCQFDVFAVEVAWHGTWRTVLVSAVGNEPLLGMRLLARHKLIVDVVPGGLVNIIPLP